MVASGNCSHSSTFLSPTAGGKLAVRWVTNRIACLRGGRMSQAERKMRLEYWAALVHERGGPVDGLNGGAFRTDVAPEGLQALSESAESSLERCESALALSLVSRRARRAHTLLQDS